VAGRWSDACQGLFSWLHHALGLSSSMARWTLFPCLAPASQTGCALASSWQLVLAWLQAAMALGSVGTCCGVTEVGTANV